MMIFCEGLNMAKGLVSGGKKKIRYAPKQGDVIAIKIRPKKFVLAKVAYVSEYHRGVLFFRVYNEVFPSAEAPAKLPPSTAASSSPL